MKKEQDRNPRQSEFNLATVNGEQVFLPHDDLYIPPNALKIFLESLKHTTFSILKLNLWEHKKDLAGPGVYLAASVQMVTD